MLEFLAARIPVSHTWWTVDSSGKMGHEPTYGGIRSSRKMTRKGHELGRRKDNPEADVKNDFFVGRRLGERWINSMRDIYGGKLVSFPSVMVVGPTDRRSVKTHYRTIVVMAGSKGKERFRRPLRQLKLCQKRLSSAEPFPPRAPLTNHGFDTDP